MRVKIPRERVSAWIEALRAVEETVNKLTQLLRKLTVIFHGSYVRGDFNLWSDIDLIVVSPVFENTRILDRYEIIAKALEPGVEPVLLTPNEFIKALRKPVWRQALRRGYSIVTDTLGLKTLVEEAVGVKPIPFSQLKNRVKKLMEEA